MERPAFGVIRFIRRLRPALPRRLADRMLTAYWTRIFEFESEELHQAELKRAGATAAEDRPEIVRATAEDLAFSERGVLLRAVAEEYPFTSLLEVGCSYGQNFHVLARQYPRSVFVGVDRDPARVRAGQALLQDRGLTNAALLEGDMRALDTFPDGAFDLVTASAALLYVSRDDIEAVVRDLLRLAKRTILLLEQQHSTDENGVPGPYGMEAPAMGSVPAWWGRDYLQLFLEVDPSLDVSAERVLRPRWQTEDWRNAAALITVRKR